MATEKLEIYRCPFCGGVVEVLTPGENPVCCGKEMLLMNANTSDGATEKHVPVVEVCGNGIKVRVGSVSHPMTPEHYIAFIYVETARGGIRIDLKDKPEAEICLCMEKPIAVYEYCNLHGLWKINL